MAITIELPADLEERLRATTPDFDVAMKRALAIELYREHRISQGQFARTLGITRMEADGVLKDAKVYLEMTIEDVIADSETSRRVRHAAGRFGPNEQVAPAGAASE